MTEQAPQQAEKFEELLQLLDEAVIRLESTDLSLDEAMSCYEEAVDLALRCTRLLDDADLRIRQIDAKLASVDTHLDHIDDNSVDEDDEVPFD